MSDKIRFEMKKCNYQAYFQQRWPYLNHPHVRSLAWLLDSSVLLNPDVERWANKVAELPPVNQITSVWLAELDKNPDPLSHYLAVHSYTRLGHYAENLLAFYFLWTGELAAHSIQVHSTTTVGEFDFLLNTQGGFEHWEFACKFYLLIKPEANLANYVGPNLMDNLNDKTKKIMENQLALGQHPDAKKYLPIPLTAAKALIKGWLFYPSSDTKTLTDVAPQHCRGLWCRLSELKKLNGDAFTVLTRLHWLAPAKVVQSETINFSQLQAYLTHLFLTDFRPVLLAQLVPDENFFVESERIFVVPDDWNL